jgi:hypothetical protein
MFKNVLFDNFSQVKKLVFENDLPKNKAIKTTTNADKTEKLPKKIPFEVTLEVRIRIRF